MCYKKYIELKTKEEEKMLKINERNNERHVEVNLNRTSHIPLHTSQRGITLIALIITIIIMLILVAVTITMAINGGLFEYVGRAGRETNEAIKSEQELASLQDGLSSDDLIAKYTGGWYEKADGTFTNGKYTVELGDYINYECYNSSILSSKLTYTSYSKDSASSEKNNGRNTGLSSDYDDEIGNQTFTVTEDSNDIKWQVMGVENGNLLIVMEGQVYADGSDGYYLRGAEALNYGIAELNEISKIYGNGEHATGARSIKVEDVNKITGYNPLKDANYEGKAFGYREIFQYGNKVTYTLTSTGVTYSGTNGKTGTCTDSSVKLMKPGDTTNTSPLTVESTSYEYSADILPDTDTTKKAVAFLSESADYWLGSSHVCANEGNVYWGFFYVVGGGVNSDVSFWDSNGGASGTYYGLRPVVSLKSDIKLKPATAANTWDFDTTAE